MSSVENLKIKVDILEETRGNVICLVKIELIPIGGLEEVHLAVSVDEPLKLNPSTEFYLNLTETVYFETYINLDSNLPIQSLSVKVIVTYITSDGFPRVLQETKTISFQSVMLTTQANKDNSFKVVLGLNQPAVPISELFSGKSIYL